MARRNGCGCGCLGTLALLAVIVVAAAILWSNRLDVAEWLYPRAHESQVEAECDQYGVDKWLVMAVIRQESNYDGGAVSSAGATGLMQLMPETAQWAIAEAGFPFTTEEALSDAACNIKVGVWYLHWLEEAHYPSNPVCVVAAYNAGASTVDSWLANGEWDGTLAGAAHIPYGETRRYVADVFRSYRAYQWLYE